MNNILRRESYKISKQRIEAVGNGYRKTKIGILPNDWDVLPVNKLVKKIKKPVHIELDKMYKQIGIRSHGKGIFYKEEVSGRDLGNKAIFWIEPECFIANIVFAWELAVAKTTKDELGRVASHRFPMYKPLCNKLDLDYMLYFFKSQIGKKLLNLASPGGAGRNKTLGQKEFDELIIPVPNIYEQEKIAKIIAIWDKAIDLKEQLIAEKKKKMNGLMQKMLSGVLRFQNFDKDWRTVHFSDCLKSISVKKNQVKTNEYNEVGQYPIIDQGKKKVVGYSNNTDKLFRCPRSGVIVFGDHTRELKFIDFDFIIGADGTRVLESEENYSTKYLFYQLKIKKIQNAGYGRHFKFLKEMSFGVPDINEQETISNILNSFDKEIDLLEQELAAIKLQKKGLMQLLLTGFVRVQH